MLFSFDFHEQADENDWSGIDACLPDEYRIPDIHFLRSVQPDVTKELVKNKTWLNTASWEGDSLFWATVTEHVPPGYRIPDIPLLQRLLRV